MSDDLQQDKIRNLERKFKFSFAPWLYKFAMTVNEPVKVYSWLHASRNYDVHWDDATRVMDFTDKGDAGREWAKFGMVCVKNYLGQELYRHFGKIVFSLNGKIQLEAVDKKTTNVIPAAATQEELLP